MRTSRFLLALAAASCCSPAFAEDPVNIGDVVLGLSTSSGPTSTRQVRAGVQYREARSTSGGVGDPFPGTGTGSRGAWTTQSFLQSVEFDNANGFSHNARGNLLALNFGSAGTGTANGGQLFALSTNGSNTTSPILYSFNPAGTGELNAQRSAGLAVNPVNTKVAGSFFESGRVWVLDYNPGAAIGTGTGVSVSNFSKSAPINTVSHTFGVTFLNNNTLIVVYTNISVTTVATVSFDPATNVFGSPLVRTQIQPFNGSGNSRVTDVEYNPLVSPYVYVFYSLFSGATENKLSVIDPATWSELKTIDLSASIGTSRECSLSPDRRLYITQFSNDSQNTTYVDAINLDVDGNGTVSFADTLALGNNNSNNQTSRSLLPGTGLDTGASFSGIDVALTGPAGTPGPQVVGACCVTSVGCLAQITSAACASFGGTYQGNNSTCNGCAPVMGACCDVATGVCSTTDFVSCLNSSRLYYGDGSVCAANACEGPGACCLSDGTCTTTRSDDCFYTRNGYFQGIGSTCAASACITPGPVLTAYTFDSLNPLPDGRNLTFVASPDNSTHTPTGSFGDAGGAPYSGSNFDIFGIINRATNTDFADDSAGILPQDTFGILYTGKTDNVFGVEDITNIPEGGTGNGTATAAFTFNISGASSLQVEVDLASLGNFEDAAQSAPHSDTFGFTYSIDGGPAQPLFTSSVLVGQLTYGIMEQGSRISYIGGDALLDPIAVNNIQLRNGFIRFIAPVVGSGSVLTINFTATGDGAGEVFVFDNLTIRGATGAVNGACCRGTTCASTTGTSCSGANTQYRGNGTVCNAPGNSTMPCCKADYNHSNSVTVQDIFDFLAGYFTSDPFADINGGGVSVQDIFDYLGAYFASGC